MKIPEREIIEAALQSLIDHSDCGIVIVFAEPGYAPVSTGNIMPEYLASLFATLAEETEPDTIEFTTRTKLN